MNPDRVQEWCEVLTLTWVHSLWLGAVLGLGVTVLLGVLCRASAAVRYVVALLGLCVFAISVLVTGIMMAQRLEVAPKVQAAVRSAEVSEQVLLPTVMEVPEVAPINRELPELLVLQSNSPPVDEVEPAVSTPGLWLRMRSLALVWAPWIVGLWMGGTSILALRFSAGWFGLRRLRREGLRPVAKVIETQLADLSRKLGVRVAVRVMDSTLTLTPIILGWTKPLILLPAGMACGLSGRQMEAILLHELAHIRRHDFLANVVQRVIETVFFYHPAVWFLSRRVRIEREHCCDDLAAAACGDRVRYASVLTLVEGYRQSTELALAMGQKPLVTRIQRLLQPAPRRSLPVGAFCGVLVVGLATMLAWWPASSRAQVSEPGVGVASDVRGVDASLYAVVGVVEDQELWQVDFREGKEVEREMIMKVREFEPPEAGPVLHRDRYAISGGGVVIDLEKRRVLRRSNDSSVSGFVGVRENQVFYMTGPWGINQVSAFDLVALTEQPVLPIERGGIMSPDGDWWLDRMDGRRSGPRLIRLADELTINCPIVPQYFANPLSSFHLGAAMLWLDNETVLIGATNTDWITMNVFGEVEEIVTIPALDHQRWFKEPNLRLGAHRLFRDPLGTVVYEAEQAFAIDVEAKTWRPYIWHQLGHEFSVKPEWTPLERSLFRYRGESIGYQPVMERLAIADYLVAADLNKVSYWSTDTQEWVDLGMKSARVLGWVDHRSPSKALVKGGSERPGGPLVVRDWGTYVLGGGEEDRRHSVHVYGGSEGMKLKVAAGAEEPWELTLHERAPRLSKDVRNELRKVPARYLRTDTSEERFLSYQAPKSKALSSTVSVGEDGIRFVLSPGQEVLPRSVLGIINEDGHYRIAVGWATGGQKEVLMPIDQFREVDREHVLKFARQLWRSAGATNAEVAVLIKSCEDDLLETPGLLCVYPMMDVDVPLSVDPAPAEIHRRVVVLERQSLEIPGR